MSQAPISSIQRDAGIPKGRPHTLRKTAIISRLVSGLGATTLTGAAQLRMLQYPFDRAAKILLVNPRNKLPPTRQTTS